MWCQIKRECEARYTQAKQITKIFTTRLEVGKSSFLAENTSVLCNCSENSSGKSSRLSRPGKDKSSTQLGKEAHSMVDNSDFIREKGKAGDSEKVDISEWKSE